MQVRPPEPFARDEVQAADANVRQGVVTYSSRLEPKGSSRATKSRSLNLR